MTAPDPTLDTPPAATPDAVPPAEAPPDAVAPPSAAPPSAARAAAARTAAAHTAAAALGPLADIELDLTVELGRCRIALGDVARLGPGSVVELDTLVGEPIGVFANGRRIATGEAVVVDGQFGIRIEHLDG